MIAGIAIRSKAGHTFAWVVGRGWEMEFNANLIKHVEAGRMTEEEATVVSATYQAHLAREVLDDG